jgi:hypothetical protein
MSTEWSHYHLKCAACGAEGSLSMWSDDWNRWGVELVGFTGKVRLTGWQKGELKCESCASAAVNSLAQ